MPASAKGRCAPREAATTLELVCRPDRLAYAVRDDIPMMLPEEARVLGADDPLHEPLHRFEPAFHIVIPARLAASRLPGKPRSSIGRPAPDSLGLGMRAGKRRGDRDRGDR